MIEAEKIFREDAITRYPTGLKPVNLTHSYEDRRLDSQGNPIDFQHVSEILGNLKDDVFAWYQNETGRKIDAYNLGEMRDTVQRKFMDDARFLEALDILELDPEKSAAITIPWWNEVAAGEVSHELLNNKVVYVQLRPRHSYETQYVRTGLDRPIKNVSVGGLVLTSPEEGTPQGFVVLGIRGGETYANTYHINAGALKATPLFKKGLVTVYDIFRKHELAPEFGISDDAIVEASLHSHIDDQVIEKGPMYIFCVRASMKREELQRAWESNRHEDKAEHRELVFIRAEPEVVNDFIATNYRGIVENRPDRSAEDRFLLHPGALALASFSGMEPEELKKYFREGIW